MNRVAEMILAAASLHCPISSKLVENIGKLQAQNDAWRAARNELKPVLDAFEALGADLSVSDNGEINVRISGDKECFVNCWKLWRSIGVRLSPPEKGATELYQHLVAFSVRIWFHFSSTVCKRVQVGTRTEQVPVYETQCGETLTTPLIEDLP